MHNKKFFLFLNSDVNQPQPTGNDTIAMMNEAQLRSVIEQRQKASELQAVTEVNHGYWIKIFRCPKETPRKG